MFFFCEILKCQNLKFFSRINPYGNEKIFNVLSFIPIFFYLSPRKSKSKSGRRNSIVAVKWLFCRVRLLTVNKHKKRKNRKEKIKSMIRKQKIGVYRCTSCSTMHLSINSVTHWFNFNLCTLLAIPVDNPNY